DGARGRSLHRAPVVVVPTAWTSLELLSPGVPGVPELRRHHGPLERHRSRGADRVQRPTRPPSRGRVRGRLAPASPTAFVTRGTTARSGPSAPRGRVLWSLRRGVHLFEVVPVLLVQRAQVGLDHRFVVAPQRGVVEVRTSGEYPAGVVVTVDLTLDD